MESTRNRNYISRRENFDTKKIDPSENKKTNTSIKDGVSIGEDFQPEESDILLLAEFEEKMRGSDKESQPLNVSRKRPPLLEEECPNKKSKQENPESPAAQEVRIPEEQNAVVAKEKNVKLTGEAFLEKLDKLLGGDTFDQKLYPNMQQIFSKNSKFKNKECARKILKAILFKEYTRAQNWEGPFKKCIDFKISSDMLRIYYDSLAKMKEDKTEPLDAIWNIVKAELNIEFTSPRIRPI